MEQLTFRKYRVSMLDFIAESATAVLVGIDNKSAVWIDKKYIFKCDFCLKANVSLVEEWEYRVVDMRDAKKYQLVKVDELVNHFNKLKPNFFATLNKK